MIPGPPNTNFSNDTLDNQLKESLCACMPLTLTEELRASHFLCVHTAGPSMLTPTLSPSLAVVMDDDDDSCLLDLIG